jgi:hypothetical protein
MGFSFRIIIFIFLCSFLVYNQASTTYHRISNYQGGNLFWRFIFCSLFAYGLFSLLTNILEGVFIKKDYRYIRLFERILEILRLKNSKIDFEDLEKYEKFIDKNDKGSSAN